MKALCGILLLAVISGPQVWARQAQPYDMRPSITVTGNAVVNVNPDKIVLTFGIETSDLEIVAAKQKNSEIMERALAAVKELGVPESEIQTDHLSIEPRYRNEATRQVFLGYFVRNGFVVTLTETGKLEELITKTLQAGVNYLHSIDFQTTEFKKYREQARELALKAAREKAEKMAAVLGQSIGMPLRITETGGGVPWGYYSSWGRGGSVRNTAMLQNVIQDMPGGSGEMQGTIALGKIAIRASVSVTFELR